MSHRNNMVTVAVAILILAVGCLFVDCNPWLGYTDSAILYLAAIVGAGCYRLGSARDR